MRSPLYNIRCDTLKLYTLDLNKALVADVSKQPTNKARIALGEIYVTEREHRQEQATPTICNFIW